jgi:hypothetical protein
VNDIISGKVISPLERHESKKGSISHSFIVRYKNKAVGCYIYPHMVEKECDMTKIRPQLEVACRGFFGKEQGDMFEANGNGDGKDWSRFVVKWFTVLTPGQNAKDLPKESQKEHWVKCCGGLDAIAEYRARAAKIAKQEQLKRVVRGGVGEWLPEKDVVEYMGRCMKRIEYCMEVLGAFFVTERLQQFRQAGGRLDMKAIKEGYEAELVKLVQEAKKAEGESVPF